MHTSAKVQNEIPNIDVGRGLKGPDALKLEVIMCAVKISCVFILYTMIFLHVVLCYIVFFILTTAACDDNVFDETTALGMTNGAALKQPLK